MGGRSVVTRSAAAGLGLALAAGAASSQAAFPGRSGKILYTQLTGRSVAAYVVDPRGGRPRRLLANVSSGSWSPDGRRLAFVGARGGGRSAIYVGDSRGRRPRRLTSGGVYGTVSWSPDGQRLAFDEIAARGRRGRPGIHVMNADGTGRTRLTTAADAEPVFSPDGTRISFTRSARRRANIWLMRADGAGQAPLTSYPGIASAADWSPDGRTIAFSAVRRRGGGLYVVGPDGFGLRRLPGTNGTELGPVFSPDGARIAFSRAELTRGGRPRFEAYVMDADGGRQRRLTRNRVDDIVADWQPLR